MAAARHADEQEHDAKHLAHRAALFGKDFTRHLAAADMLLSALAEDFQAVLAALDLVFRWVVLRLCEGNMQALVKVCELTDALLNTLYEHVSIMKLVTNALHAADVSHVDQCTACKEAVVALRHLSSCVAQTV